MDIVDCYEGPGQVVAVAYALKKCGVGGKTRCGMEIPDCAFDAGELIDVLYSLQRGWAGRIGVEQGEVGMHFGSGRYNVG